MIKKKIAMLLTAAVIICGCTIEPAFAQSTENAEATVTTEAKEQKEAQTSTRQPEEEKDTKEKSEALTPDGNMTLVDSTASSSGSKQFLTLTSRDGNFYYLIIDHDKDGNENVHFLNQVDERDLLGLMDEKEAKEIENQRQEEEAAAAAQKAVKNSKNSADTKEEDAADIAGHSVPKKTLVAGAGLLVLLAGCGAGLVVLNKKKKAEPKKPDPDADYEEDEFGVELDMMDDEDFEDTGEY